MLLETKVVSGMEVSDKNNVGWYYYRYEVTPPIPRTMVD
jgi:hypothetical protein